MASEKIILYDIPCKDLPTNVCWSLNPWKTRIQLKFKGIDYDTEWLEYPDIAPTLKGYGIPPGTDQDTPYTVPAVKFPDGTYSMNSKAIHAEIEARYPAPDYPVVPYDGEGDGAGITQRMYDLASAFQQVILPVLLPPIPRNILPDRSAEYFQRTRAEWFGMSLDELERTQGGEQAWEKGKEPLGKINDLLKERSGPYFQGESLSWADCVFAGFLEFIKRVVGEAEFKRRIEAYSEIITFYKACEKFFE